VIRKRRRAVHDQPGVSSAGIAFKVAIGEAFQLVRAAPAA
jgi:hypothetical protein